jgi:hypothetical protein
MYCPAGIIVAFHKRIDTSARLATIDRYRPRSIEPFAQRPRQLRVVTHNRHKIPRTHYSVRTTVFNIEDKSVQLAIHRTEDGEMIIIRNRRDIASVIQSYRMGLNNVLAIWLPTLWNADLCIEGAIVPYRDNACRRRGLLRLLKRTHLCILSASFPEESLGKCGYQADFDNKAYHCLRCC